MLLHDESICTGCQVCQVACQEYHHLPADSPLMRVTEQETSGGKEAYRVRYRIKVCRQCARPSCLFACPHGAIRVDEASDAVLIREDRCTGCGRCVEACPFHAVVLYTPAGAPDGKRKAIKCMECREKGRGVPVCVAACPYGCLTVGRRRKNC